MSKLSKKATNIITIVAVLVIAAGATAYFILSGGATNSVTAQFSSAVGVYSGTPVKILGIDVGEVTGVKPNGATVSVKMEYESKYHLPKNAIAVIVANSLVSDRFIQLAPAYPGSGPTLAADATIPQSRTAAPAELDDIYAALNKLSVALGPNGANKNGSLRELVNVGAANLQGNGAALGQQHHPALRGSADSRRRTRGSVRHGQELAGVHQGPLGQRCRRCGTSTSSSPRSPVTWPTNARTWVRPCTTWAMRSTRSRPSSTANANKFHGDIVGLEKLTKASWSTSRVHLTRPSR